MQHVVVDTNVLVRALLKPSSSDGNIFRRFLSQDFKLYYSEYLLTELGRVLGYPRLFKKYHLTPLIIETFLKTITTFGILVAPRQYVSICRDPDDNEIISLALSISEREVFLISADKDLLVLQKELSHIKILTPQEFLKQD